MKITLQDIDGQKVALCHLMLNNEKETIQAIVNSDDWKLPEDSKDKFVNVTMQFNGVEADPNCLEKLMTDWYHAIHAEYKKQYSDLDAEVERRVYDRIRIIEEERIKPYEEKIGAVIKNLEEAQINLNCIPWLNEKDWNKDD